LTLNRRGHIRNGYYCCDLKIGFEKTAGKNPIIDKGGDFKQVLKD